MSRRWMGLALLAGWLGVSSAASAQYPVPGGAAPGSPQGPLPGYAPLPADAPPGFPVWTPPPPPPVDAPSGPEETLPPNSFSNVHPEQIRPATHFAIEADYLLWWIRKRQIPPLATEGNINDAIPGALGQPGTTLLLGPGSADTDQTTGGRVSAYYWFDQGHTWGIDATGFIMEQRAALYDFGGSANGSLVLSRPYFNPNTNAPDADPLVVPGVQTGNLVVSLPRRMYGGDANVRYSQCNDFFIFDRVTMLGGVRYLYLDEKVLLSEGVVDQPDELGNPGDTLSMHDNFTTYNRFYGAQLGFETETHVGPVVFLVNAKVAVGDTRREINISGDTTLTDPIAGVVVDPTRGLLVQPTNSGRFSSNTISVVPELNVKLTYEFNENLSFSLGYTFLYWSSVFRPGDQIDPTVNVGPVGFPGVLGTSPNPVVPYKATGFWAQGFSAGIMVSF